MVEIRRSDRLVLALLREGVPLLPRAAAAAPLLSALSLPGSHTLLVPAGGGISPVHLIRARKGSSYGRRTRSRSRSRSRRGATGVADAAAAAAAATRCPTKRKRRGCCYLAVGRSWRFGVAHSLPSPPAARKRPHWLHELFLVPTLVPEVLPPFVVGSGIHATRHIVAEVALTSPPSSTPRRPVLLAPDRVSPEVLDAPLCALEEGRRRGSVRAAPPCVSVCGGCCSCWCWRC